LHTVSIHSQRLRENNRVTWSVEWLGPRKIVEEYKLDDFCKTLIQDLQQTPPPNYALDFWIDDQSLLWNAVKLVFPTEGREEATGKSRLVIPRGLQERVISLVHDPLSAGHPGVTQTYKAVAERFFFTGHMYKSVTKYVRSCLACAKAKKQNRNRETQQSTRSIQALLPMSLVSADIVGPLPEARTWSGKRVDSIVVFRDYASGAVYALPVEGNVTAEQVAHRMWRTCIMSWAFLIR
jgi:hypothetical protein